jgi:hypothetical protein
MDYGVKSYGRIDSAQRRKWTPEYVGWAIAGFFSVFVVPAIGGVVSGAVRSAWPLILSLALVIGLTVWLSVSLQVRGYLLGVMMAVVVIGLLVLGCGIVVWFSKPWP